MTSAIDRLLAEVKRVTGCEVVSGDVLPLPPSSLPDTNALIVNCFCGSDTLLGGGKSLLDRCRVYASDALRSIASFIGDEELNFDTIGVSIFRNDESAKNLRVYWANSRKTVLSNAEQPITSEGSHLDEVSVLLDG